MDKRGYYEVRREIEGVWKNSGCASKKKKVDELTRNEDDHEIDMTTDITTDIEAEELQFNISESEFGSEITADASDKPHEPSLCFDVASWCVEYRISEAAGNGLLKILKKYHPNIPQSIKTLKKHQAKTLNPEIFWLLVMDNICILG